MGKPSTLLMDLRYGEVVSLSSTDGVQIELVEKSGKYARLRISAPLDVKIKKQVSECRTLHDSIAPR